MDYEISEPICRLMEEWMIPATIAVSLIATAVYFFFEKRDAEE